MRIVTKILLVAVYPFLLMAWLVNLLLGRDRLRLYNIPSEESCWIERRGQPNTATYFLEASCSEGDQKPSAARPLARLLRGIARFYTPPRQVAGAVYKPSAERERSIPDEIYTLW
jgi:hypothetical protein